MAGDDEKEDTRAIARQAVEAEFRKKKNRKRAGYDSSDDEDGGGRQRDRHNKKSKTGEDVMSDATKKKATRPLAVWEVKYRDRAKERREGKEPAVAANDAENDDEDAPPKSAKQSLLDDVFEDDTGQNGDEPVKGLDRRLIQKQHRHHDDEDEDEESPYVNSREEALDWIASADAENSVSSNLGKDMLAFFRREYLPAPDIKEPTPAGIAVQRSTLIFSTTAIPGIASQAWEVPRQEMAAAASSTTTTTTMSENHNILPKVSPINDSSLLERMQRLLDRQRNLEEQEKAAAVVKNEASSKKPMIAEDDDDDIFQVSDDEDYFEKISDEKKKKPSLAPAGETSSNEKSRRTFFFNKPQKPESPADAGNNAPKSEQQPAIQKLERFSAVDGGGYDDEGNDVDFDGRLEDDEEEDEKKKKTKKKRKRKKKDDDDSD